MTPADAAEALAMAAAFDNRTVTRIAAEAWAAAMPHIDLDDAKAAIVAHYAESAEWLKPAHITGRVKALRAARLASGTNADGIPDADPDDPAAYNEALRAKRYRIAGGETARDVTAVVAQLARTTYIPRRDA